MGDEREKSSQTHGLGEPPLHPTEHGTSSIPTLPGCMGIAYQSLPQAFQTGLQAWPRVLGFFLKFNVKTEALGGIRWLKLYT